MLLLAAGVRPAGVAPRPPQLRGCRTGGRRSAAAAVDGGGALGLPSPILSHTLRRSVRQAAAPTGPPLDSSLVNEELEVLISYDLGCDDGDGQAEDGALLWLAALRVLQEDGRVTQQNDDAGMA